MSNVGQIALDVVGLVATIYTGNPIFLTLAMAAGNVLFPTQLPAGPRLTDHRTTTASLGDPVALVFGTSTVAGTVIWLAPSVESKNSSGKGGPQQTTYSYTQSIAIGLCESVIDGVQAIGGLSRVWENGTIVYDIRPQLQANTYTGVVAETDQDYQNRLTASAAYAEKFTLYLGTETQEPDPTIEAIEGTGNVPGYRGLAYIVFPNRQLQTAQGWRHPNFQFEVYQAGIGTCTTTTEYSNDVLYPWINDSADPTNPRNTNTFHISNVDPRAPTYVNPGNLNQYSTLSAALAVADASQGITMDTPVLYHTWSVAGGGEDQTMRGGDAPGPNIVTYGAGDMSFVDVYYSFTEPSAGHYYSATTGLPVALPNGLFSFAGSICIPLGYTSTYGTAPTPPAPYLQVTVGQPYGTAPWWYAERNYTVIKVTRTPGPPINPCDELPDWPQDPENYCVNTDGTIVQKQVWTRVNGYFFVLGTFTGSPDTNTPCLYPANPCVPYASAEATDEAFWVAAYNQAVLNGSLPPGYTYVAGGGQTETKQYPQLQDYAWQLDRTTCVGLGSQASVGEIINALCARSGLDAVDTDDLESTYIGGYTIANLSSAASIIGPLRSVAFFDCVESGDVLRFQSRGKPTVATLTTDDLGAYDSGKGDNVPPSVSTTRTLDIDLPRRVRFHYASTSRDYQDAEQDSPFRLTTTAVNDTDVSLPLSLGDTQAVQSAEIVWADAWEGRTAHTIALDQSWSFLEPGDCVIVPVDDVEYRCRIVSYKVASGILMTLSLVRDNGDNYFSTAIAEPPKYTSPTLTFLAQTQAVFLDLPSLQDADADPGFYIAAARNPSTGNAWKGATIYQSVDAGVTFTQLETITTEATIGTLANAVTPSDSATWDTTTEILVNVASNAFTFESRTDDAVIAGANAAAMGADGRWEIIQFANAELVSSSQWKLTRLLRGRRGTEHNIPSSRYGDLFVMVSTGDLVRVPQGVSAIGASRVYKAVTSEAAYSTAITSTFTGHGEALVPFSPIDVTAALQVDGDIIVAWVRRDRLGHTLMSGVALPMSETVEAYSVDILEQASPPTVVRTVAVGPSKTFTYTAAQQATDFPGGALHSLSLRVYQLSSVVGRGTPATATIELANYSDTVSDNLVTHSSTVTFGGSFDSTDNATVSATYTPVTGVPSLYQWTLSGSGKSAVADYATDLATQAATSLAGKATVTHSGSVVTMTTTSGTIVATYVTNKPTAQVTVVRPATAPQAGVRGEFSLDLYTRGGELSPTNDPSYEVSTTAMQYFVITAYAPEVEATLNGGAGIQVSVPYTTVPSNNYFNDIYNLAAAMNASSELAPYLAGATAGTVTGTEYSMTRPAIYWMMKLGYAIGDAYNPTHPSGWVPMTTCLTPGEAPYPSGAPKIVDVLFVPSGVDSTGSYYSTLEAGQVYRITINGTSYTHTLTSGDIAAGDFGSLYTDLGSQIETAGFTVATTSVDITITGPSISDFTLTAQVDFDLTVAIVNS